MLFDKEKYYKYTNSIKSDIAATYSINTIISIIIIYIVYQFIENIFISILIFIINIIISNMQTQKLELKIQEMYWKLDIYDNIYKIANKKAD